MGLFPARFTALRHLGHGLAAEVEVDALLKTYIRALSSAEAEFETLARPQYSNTPEHARWSDLKIEVRQLKEAVEWLLSVKT